MATFEEVKQILERINPYEYAGRIKKPELFIDRVTQLHHAFVTCEQIALGRTGGVLVIGGKGAGKTSFLEALHRELDNQKIANVVIPLDEKMVAPGKEAKLFKFLLGELTTAAQQSGLLEKSLSSKIREYLGGVLTIEQLGLDLPGLSILVKAAAQDTYNDFGYTLLRDGLRDYRKLIGAGKSESRGAILLLDEGDGLLLNRPLLQIFRNVLQDMEGIGLVVAGTSRLEEKVTDIFSPISRFFRPIELGPFDNDSDVVKTIAVGLKSAETHLANKGISFSAIHDEFDQNVIQLSGGSPYEVNLLSYLAFEEGSSRFQLVGNGVTLYMKVDEHLLEITFRALKGRKAYGDFIQALNQNQKDILRLLSQSKYGASEAELIRLSMLDDAAKKIDSLSPDDFIGKDSELSAYSNRIQAALKSIQELGDKFSIPVLSIAVKGKSVYQVEDQWIRASSKYGSVEPKIDLGSGIIGPSHQARVYGDPVASILDTIFLPEVVGKLVAPGTWRTNNYPNDGSQLPKTAGSKWLNCVYVRIADNEIWHMSYQVRKTEDVSETKRKMEGVLTFLADRGIIGDLKVVEQ